VRIVATIIGRVLADAKRKGTIERNVAPLADAPSGEAVRAPEADPWDLETTAKFLAELLVCEHELYALFWLAALTGMRRGELCGLRWSDVDLDAGIVSVEQGATAIRADAVHLGALKTRKAKRVVEIEQVDVDVLRAHQARQRSQRLALGAGWRGETFDLVFADVDGTPRTPNTITARWNRLVARTGYRPVRFHDLRHGHATHRAAMGEHPHTTAERLGHASAAFTLDRYTHRTTGAQRRVSAQIEAALTGSRNPLVLVEDADAESRDHPVTKTGVEAPNQSREAL
jgi:integrase